MWLIQQHDRRNPSGCDALFLAAFVRNSCSLNPSRLLAEGRKAVISRSWKLQVQRQGLVITVITSFSELKQLQYSKGVVS
jgi:hypothetical protein